MASHTTSITHVGMVKDKRDTILSVCVFLSGFSCFAQLYYFQPLLPDLASTFGLSASLSSLAVSFSTLGMVAGLITMMFLADALDRKRLIGAALLSSALISTLCSFATSFALLVALCTVKGFLLSGATSVSMAYIAEEVQSRRRSQIMGLYIAGNAIGGMCGRVIASFISAAASWRVASIVIGAVCALFAAAFLFYSPHSTQSRIAVSDLRATVRANLSLITSRRLIPFYLTGGMMLGIFVSLYNYLGFFLAEPPFDFSPAYIHYIFLLYIFGVFGSVFTAYLTQRFNRYAVQRTVVLACIPALLLLFIPTMPTVTLGVGIFTFGFFVVHVICNRVISDYGRDKKSAALSMYLLCYYLGSSFLGWGTGIILDHSTWQWFIAGLIGLTVVLFGIVYIGTTRLQREEAHTWQR